MNSTFSQLYLVTRPVYKAVLSNIYDKGQMDELNELNKETMLPTIDEKNNDNVENNTRSDNDNSTENMFNNNNYLDVKFFMPLWKTPKSLHPILTFL